MKNLKFLLSLLLINSILLYSCKKDSNSSLSKSHLEIISNSSLANTTKQLQGIYSEDGSDKKTYYYGDFDASGNPEVLKYAEMVKENNDTTLHYTFDDTLRVKTMYVSVNNVKDSILVVFDYSDTKVTARLYFVDWTTGTYLARNELTINKSGDVYTFSSFHPLRLSSNQNTNSTEKTTGDPITTASSWIVQTGAAQSAIAVCNGIIKLGTLNAAVLLSASSPILSAAAVIYEVSAVNVQTIEITPADIITHITTAPSTAPAPPSQLTLTIINSIVPPPPSSAETCTDIDGNVYQTVTIGAQVWMKENLKTTRYNDGTAIPTGLSDSAWLTTTTGAYAIYNNEAANNTTYGKLYNWYAVNTGKLAPAGWHVPTDADWSTLTNNLGGQSVAGGKMKSTTLWNSPNTDATNSSGFSALPAGSRNYLGICSLMGNFGYFWSSTEESSTSNAWYRTLYSNNATVTRNLTNKIYGFSVRCVRD